MQGDLQKQWASGAHPAPCASSERDAHLTHRREAPCAESFPEAQGPCPPGPTQPSPTVRQLAGAPWGKKTLTFGALLSTGQSYLHVYQTRSAS